MSNETITLTILAKDLASGNIGGLVGRLDAMAKRGGLAGSVMQGVGLSIGTMLNPIGLVTRGIGAFTDLLSDSVNKAAEEQVGLEKLSVALQDNIPSWNGNTDAIEGVIAAREKLAFSDDEQRDSLSQLVTRTHDVTKALDLERLAMDLARAKSIPLADSATIIGKVYSGNVAILKRYGIAVTEGATATEALEQIQRATAGQADAYGNTLRGAQESLKIAIDDAEESIGAKLLPTIKDLVIYIRDEVVPGVLKFVDAMGELGTQIDNLHRLQDPNYSHMEDFNKALHAGAEQLGMTDEELRTYIASQEKYRANNLSTAEATTILNAAIGDLTTQQNAAAAASGIFGLKFHIATATISKDAPEAVAAADALAKDIAKSQWDAANSAIQAAQTIGPGIRDTLKASKDSVHAAAKDLAWAIEHPMAVAHRRTALEAQLTSKDLLAGLKSKNPEIHQAAVNWQNTILDELAKLPGAAGRYGADAGNNLAAQFDATRGGSIFGFFNVGGSSGTTQPQSHKHHQPHGGGRASGGPVEPGETVTVGERGEETLTMYPGGGGFVTPHNSGAGGVHVHLHGIFAGTEDGLRKLGELLMPAITRAQRRGQVAG